MSQPDFTRDAIAFRLFHATRQKREPARSTLEPIAFRYVGLVPPSEPVLLPSGMQLGSHVHDVLRGLRGRGRKGP